MYMSREAVWWVPQVMKGMQEGTLIDKDAAEVEEREGAACAALSAAPSTENGNGTVPDVGREMAQAARAASRKLQAAPTGVRMRLKSSPCWDTLAIAPSLNELLQEVITA